VTSPITWRYVGSQWIGLHRHTGDTLAWCVADHAGCWWVVWPATAERWGPYGSALEAQTIVESWHVVGDQDDQAGPRTAR
jgi:hypothetical protein